MSKVAKLLPLGTAVRIKNDDSHYILIARIFRKQETGEITAVYRGVPHPFGEGSGYKTIVIDELEITQVAHLGYEDDLDKPFTEQLLDKALAAQKQVNDGASVETTKTNKPSKTQLATVKSVQEKIKLPYPNDPFYKLRERGN